MQSSSSTRASRSRISSPFSQAANGSNEKAKDASRDSQKTLDQWLEPPVRVKASYQDAGLMRHGVVENMAPLGTLPKLGHFKSAAPSPVTSEPPAVQTPPPKTRIVVKGRLSGKASASRDTPQPPLPQPQTQTQTQPPLPAQIQTDSQAQSETPEAQASEASEAPEAPEPAQEQSQEQPMLQPQREASPPPPAPTPTPQVDDDEDETEEEEVDDDKDGGDGERDSGAHASMHGRRSVASSGDLDDEWAPRSSSYKGMAHRPLSRTSAGRSGSFSFAGSYQQAASASPDPINKEKMDRVVTDAVNAALSHFRYPTAWALRTLYEEHSENNEFLAMLEQVVLQTADAATVQRFARLLHDQKREGKTGNKGCYYFVPPSTNTHFAPHKPVRAPHRNLLRLNIEDLHIRTRSASARARESGSEAVTEAITEAVTEAVTEIAQELKAESEQEGEVPSTPSQGQDEAVGEPPEQDRTEFHHTLDLELNPQSESEEPAFASVTAPADGGELEVDESDAIAESRTKDATKGAIEEAAFAPASALAPAPAPATLSTTTEPPPQATPSRSRVKKRRSGRHHRGSASKMGLHGLVNGKTKSTDSPSRRRTRANSLSSSSSLSSARSMTPPEGIEEEDVFEVPDSSRASPTRVSGTGRKAARDAASTPAPAPAPASSARATESSDAPNLNAHAPPARARPIRERQRANAAKKNGNVSPTQGLALAPTSSSDAQVQPHAPATEAATFSMPAEVDAPLFPNLNGKKAHKVAGQHIVFPPKVGRLDENDKKLRLRQAAKQVTNSSSQVVAESFTRKHPTDLPRLDLDEAEEPGYVPELPVGRSSRTSLPNSNLRATPGASATNGRSTRSSLKRTHDELDQDHTSPTSQVFPNSEATSTAATSRAGTPALRPVKKARTGLRVKTSPMKKKAGTSAGIPRASGERNSPACPGNPALDDNDDYCSSCGGNGELVCCDGCTCSFHLTCVDPPLIQALMPPEWFCNVCRTMRAPARLPSHAGLFAGLLEKLDSKNSSAFRLPRDIREYFQDVRTGVDGEYEEAVPPPAKPSGKGKRKNDDEHHVDYFRLRDAEGNPVMCHVCGHSALANKAIIPCPLCGLCWHLDCLDPPLANPPPILRLWKCPVHLDDLLLKIPGSLAPAHRFRKIKGAPEIQPAFSRGYVNNGHIDVDLDESEDESGWKDVQTYGRTVRLPERGIKLDFFSRVRGRENRKGKRIPPLNPPTPPAVRSASPPRLALSSRELEEQQAAQNLALLSGYGSSGVQTLIDAMLSAADSSSISLMARGNLDHMRTGQLNHLDQQSLRAMMANVDQLKDVIGQLLGTAEPGSSPPSPDEDAATASAAVSTGLCTPSGSRALNGLGQDEVEEQPLGSDPKKNLPSPAATDDVISSTKMDENPLEKTESGPRVSASASQPETDDSSNLPVDESQDPDKGLGFHNATGTIPTETNGDEKDPVDDRMDMD